MEDGNNSPVMTEGINGQLHMRYRFTEDQIMQTADLIGARQPIILKGEVRINGKRLKQLETKEEFEKYLTNYRMKASLRITDRPDTPDMPDTPPTGNVDTYDYFVYTVTRLKTDI